LAQFHTAVVDYMYRRFSEAVTGAPCRLYYKSTTRTWTTFYGFLASCLLV